MASAYRLDSIRLYGGPPHSSTRPLEPRASRGRFRRPAPYPTELRVLVAQGQSSALIVKAGECPMSLIHNKPASGRTALSPLEELEFPGPTGYFPTFYRSLERLFQSRVNGM